jgi:hypothetical protein
MSSILTYETSSTTNINGKNNIIIKNPLNSPRYQSTVMNKYENIIPTHPLSNLKQVLADQKANINIPNVCFLLFK